VQICNKVDLQAPIRYNHFTMTFSDQIRQAITDSGISRYRLCQLLGIGKASMSRFMSGKTFLSMPTLDKLAIILNMRVTSEPREYLRELPDAVPKGKVLVHNREKPSKRLGRHGGFMVWLTVRHHGVYLCNCGWAQHLGDHYISKK